MLPRRLPAAVAGGTTSGSSSRRWWLAAAVPVVMLAPRLVPVLVVALGVVVARRRLRDRRAVRSRREAVARDLPVAIALLQIAAAAGHGPRTAIAMVGEFGWGAVADVLHNVASRLAEGVPLADALGSGSLEEADPGWVRLVELCERADDDGGRWGPALDAFAEDLHRQRLAEVEERTGRLTVALLVPLVGCILPAFVAMAIVPVVGGALLELGS